MVRWVGSILKGNGFSRQAKRAFDVETQVEYCYPQYDFKVCTVCETQGHRPLIIASLKSKDKALPSFSFRWDAHGEHLNVDIEEVSRQVEELFKKGKQGYRGHSPKMVAGKLFDVRISIPAHDVFLGKISFKIHENITLENSVGVDGKVVAILKKEGKSQTIKFCLLLSKQKRKFNNMSDCLIEE